MTPAPNASAKAPRAPPGLVARHPAGWWLFFQSLADEGELREHLMASFVIEVPQVDPKRHAFDLRPDCVFLVGVVQEIGECVGTDLAADALGLDGGAIALR